MGSGPKQSEVQLENEVAYKKRETLFITDGVLGENKKRIEFGLSPEWYDVNTAGTSLAMPIAVYEDDCIGILPNHTYSNLFRWFDNRNTTGMVHFLFPLK